MFIECSCQLQRALSPIELRQAAAVTLCCTYSSSSWSSSLVAAAALPDIRLLGLTCCVACFFFFFLVVLFAAKLHRENYYPALGCSLSTRADGRTERPTEGRIDTQRHTKIADD